MHYLFMKKTVNKHIPGVNIYNNKTIVVLSFSFIVCLLIMPILYEYRYLRYVVIVGIIIAAIVNSKSILNILKRLTDKG